MKGDLDQGQLKVYQIMLYYLISMLNLLGYNHFVIAGMEKYCMELAL
jgi:hypothetical protein